MTLQQQHGAFCGRTRREFLWQAGAGFTGLALAGLLDQEGFFAQQSVAADGVTPWASPLAPKPTHFAAKAKSVIFLYMYGGPSHIDMFDYKPALIGRDNQTIEVKTHGRQGRRNQGRIVEPRWKFRQHGQSGQWVSDLLPNIARCVDDIAFVKSMTCHVRSELATKGRAEESQLHLRDLPQGARLRLLFGPAIGDSPGSGGVHPKACPRGISQGSRRCDLLRAQAEVRVRLPVERLVLGLEATRSARPAD